MPYRSNRARLPVRSRIGLAQAQPGQLLLAEYVSGGLKFGPRGQTCRYGNAFRSGGLRFRRSMLIRTGCRTRAPSSSRCRIELRYFTLYNPVGCVFECDKNRNRCATMLTATLKMAPIDFLRLTTRNKTDHAAFELVGRAAQILILRGVWSRSESRRFLFWDCARADHSAWSCSGHIARQLFARLFVIEFSGHPHDDQCLQIFRSCGASAIIAASRGAGRHGWPDPNNSDDVPDELSPYALRHARRCARRRAPRRQGR
jgi:hypothetical protein